MSLPGSPSGELVAAMLDPSFYPHRPERVELRESHISWVFLAGELAYKLKKPVVLPFLDYGTVERRRAMCREEVRLNRRLAPRHYLGVDSVISGERGPRLVSGEAQGALDYVVRMRRVAEERSLDRLARRGELTDAQVDAVARRIAEFHRAAEVAPPQARTLTALLGPFEENHRTLSEVGPPALAPSRLRAAERFTAAFLDARRSQIAARADAGLVRDCHGDLRAEHVIVDGEVVIYDCIEFNPGLRWIDVGADLAFLVMDLARLCEDRRASRLVAGYRAAGGDPGDDRLVAFYAAYRAWIRAKVAALRARELEAADPSRGRAEAEGQALLALGHRLAWRARLPAVVAICGVAATGKSTVASALSRISGLAHLSSDLTRKRLAGLAPADRGRPEHYTPEFTMRVYEELGRSARAEVERAGGAIVDATFHRRREREAFARGIGDRFASVLFCECVAPAEALRDRARRRAATGASVSDAGPEIVDRQLREWEPLTEVPPGRHGSIGTDGAVEEAVADAEDLANRLLAAA